MLRVLYLLLVLAIYIPGFAFAVVEEYQSDDGKTLFTLEHNDDGVTYQLARPANDLVMFELAEDNLPISRKLLARRNKKGGGNSRAARNRRLAKQRNSSCGFSHCAGGREVIYQETGSGCNNVLSRANQAWQRSPGHKAIINSCPGKGCHVKCSGGTALARCVCQ